LDVLAQCPRNGDGDCRSDGGNDLRYNKEGAGKQELGRHCGSRGDGGAAFACGQAGQDLDAP
jgi:hypothetical protein